MRPTFILWLFLACASAADETSNTSRDEAVGIMLSERESPAAFQAAIDAAKKAGVGEQGILEARFLYHVDRREDEKIAALAPEFLQRRDAFRLEESEIFATVEDWLAVTEYAQALAALQQQNAEAFKKHITEAFWLSPGQGAAFAPHIERLRLTEAMKEVRIDFATRLHTMHGSGATSLASINKDSPATLFHFWSPWSRECEATMPDFALTAIELAKQDIAVVSILPEQSAEVRTDALELIEPLGPNPPGTWLVDRDKSPLSHLLRIQSLPTMVLLDPDGRVLFNGHPADEEFWKSVTSIAPDATRPAAGQQGEPNR